LEERFVPRLIHRLIIQSFLNMHLRNKLFVVLGLVSVGPLIFFAVYSYETMKSELTSQMYASIASTTDQISANLKMKLDSYSKVSSSLYLDRRLRDYLTRDYSNNDQYVDAYEYINSTFRNLQATNMDFSSITVYTNNLTLPADRVFIKRLDNDMRLYPWYISASKSYGSVTFSAMPATNPTDEQVTQGIVERKPSRIVLARLLDNSSLNYPYGILTMDIPETDIYALMEKENINKELFIVSENGVIISGKDKSKLNHRLKEFVQGDWGKGKVGGSFLGLYNGERVFVVFNSIDNGWKTVSIVSYNSLLMNVKIAFSRLFTIAIASLILSVILIYITARWFTKRIETLLQLTRRIEREDFDVRTVSIWHDEVGQLSFAMIKMARRMKELINEVYKKEIAKKEAEMSMLQAQINPHFLYNTLASISSLAIRSGDNRIQDMVTHLAKFYRISLNKGKTIVGFSEELKLTKSYIAIQQLRFEGLLHVHFAIEEAALPYPVVKLMLQPFIENAINHGIWDDQAGINVIIKAGVKDNTLVLEVIDDGMGMRSETLKRINSKEDGDATSSYGIRNVDRRIKLTFGDSYGVHIFSRLGIGTAVQIRIPLGGPL
jgi:two-component system, sensor histidine kinase YesM